MDARAAVQTGDRRIELQRIPVPDSLGPDEALLAVEANGLCGTDYEQYCGNVALPYPLIAGHEIVGRIAAIGDDAAARLGIGEGARVAVESTVACGTCTNCAAGRSLFCERRMIYGLTPLAREPGLLGGYAEYLVLQANSQVYPISDALSPEDAVLFNPLGSGFDWACRAGGTKVGDTVVIFGPGQRGLACVIAAAEAGAGRIIVVGRGRRPWKLQLALELGATDVVDSDASNPAEVVREITGGTLADVAIDTTPHANQPIVDAVACARAEGVVVLAGIKVNDGITALDPNDIARKALTVRGVYSVSEWAKHQAIRVLETGRYPFERLHTHTMTIDELDLALRILGGEVDGEEALHITVTPN